MRKKYFNGNVCPIFYRGNYYKITEATKIIQNSTLSRQEKAEGISMRCVETWHFWRDEIAGKIKKHVEIFEGN